MLDPWTFAALQTRAALVGLVLARYTDDHDREIFLASKWGLTRTLGDPAAVEEFIEQVATGLKP